MRVVLDTNVLVSGVFFSGPPSRVLKAWRDGRLTLVYSAAIFEEYDRVFMELTDDFPTINARPILDLLVFCGEIVQAANITVSACRDPADDKFLQCLLASKADCLFSGDRDLLEGDFEDCSVLSVPDNSAIVISNPEIRAESTFTSWAEAATPAVPSHWRDSRPPADRSVHRSAQSRSARAAGSSRNCLPAPTLA